LTPVHCWLPTRTVKWFCIVAVWSVLILSTGFNRACLAFDVSPAVHEFVAGTKSTVQFFQVSNPDSASLVLQVLPRRVSYTLDGRQRLEEVTNVFQIFPSRLVIPPGGKQRVRVTYIPKSAPAMDSLFKILFKDLPVSVGPGGTNSGVKLTTEYHQLAVVRGGRTSPKLVIEAAGPAQGTNKFLSGLWEVIVRNDGDGFGRLGGLKGVVPFSGSTGSGSFVVTPPMITNFQSVILLPRDRRRFMFAPPAGIEKEPGEVRLDL